MKFFGANDSHEELEETQAFLHSGQSTIREGGRRWSLSVLGNFILGVLTLVLLLVIEIQHRHLNNLRNGNSYESGFTTDFSLSLFPLLDLIDYLNRTNSGRSVLAKNSIAMEEVSFTGGLLYDQNGTLYREFDANRPQYVGLPGPHIDTAWKNLISGKL
jgi:hypothetical protein